MVNTLAPRNFGNLSVWYTLIGIVLVIIIFFLFSPFFIVSPGERAVIVRLGTLQDKIYNEGIYWKTPFLEGVKLISVQSKKVEANAAAASKDLQNVDTHLAVNYNIDQNMILKIVRDIGGEANLEERIIIPSIQEVVKSTTAKFTAEELITKRASVSDDILSGLKDKLTIRGVNVEAFNIINFQFSADFNNAIENKVKAEQDALTQKNKLEQVKYEAQQQIEQAKAQAESISIQAQAVQQQGGADYVKLKWIEKWDGKLPTTTLSNGQNFIVDLNK